MTGVRGSNAVSISVTASSSSYSTVTASAASSARARSLATTAATAAFVAFAVGRAPDVGMAVVMLSVLPVLATMLFLFFCGFHALEASQPSMASRVAPAHARGAALGVYNTLQSVGFFVGGAVGGAMAKGVGYAGLFAACAGLMLLWLVVAWPMQAPPPRSRPEEVLADEAGARAT